jgi:hypothetical protein
MISEKQKLIYNFFQTASRKSQNKPYRLREDFTKIDDTTLLCLQKLESFFNSNHNINYTDFFIAPYKIFTDTSYFDIKFYVTRKAIICYTEYKKKKEVENPDNIDVINNCKDVCSFIYKFCKLNNLTLDDYKTRYNGSTPLVIQHLKDHKINFYVLQGLAIDSIINKYDKSITNFIINDFFTTYNTTRSLFIKSNNLKTIVRTALQIVEKKLLKSE